MAFPGSAKIRALPWVWLCLSIAAFCPSLTAQAWVPAKGEGTFTTTYSFVAFKGHYTTQGDKVFLGAARAQSVTFEIEYGITNKLAVTLSLPIVAVRYADTNPPIAFLRGEFAALKTSLNYNHDFLDDGSYHGTLQDFVLNLRYRVLKKPLVLTPFIAAVIPSHSYAYVGEAAPGRNLHEFRFGVNAGRRLDPFLKNAYAHFQYSYAVAERSLGISTNRSNATMEVGYFLTKKLSVRGLADWQHTYGGLRFPIDLTTPELALTHDRLLRARYWHVGGGATYSFPRRFDISGNLITFVAGNDTHFGTGFTLSISRSFGGQNSSFP